MIAKVKIAPVEQWCEWGKAAAARDKGIAESAGLEIGIETSSMRICGWGCGGRRWIVAELPDGWFPCDEYGESAEGLLMCEHELEMD